MCLDAMAVFWNGTTGAWFVHWPLVICDLMWDLRGLQKAGGSQRANYCDGFRKNQLEEKDFNVSFCFSSLMKWALTLEQTRSSRVWMDPTWAHKGLVFSLSLHLWQYWLLDLSITRQRQQVFAGLKFAELQLKCLWFDYPSNQVCGDKHSSLNHPMPLDPWCAMPRTLQCFLLSHKTQHHIWHIRFCSFSKATWHLWFSFFVTWLHIPNVPGACRDR